MDKKNLDNVQLVSKAKLFDQLSDAEMAATLDSSYIRTCKKGEYLFLQDTSATEFFIVKSGRIKLTQITPDGTQVILRYIDAGQTFGIVAVLRQIDYPVAAQALQDSELFAWTAESMKQLMFEHPQISINSIHILSKFILDFQDRIRELATENVEQRLARSLLRLARQNGRKVEKGLEIEIKLTREDIANMAGTTLYSASRILSKWETKAIISSGHNLILIAAPDTLKKIAEGKSELS